MQDGIDYGTFTNIVYRNSELAERRYQGLVFQGRYNLSPSWSVNGLWTVQLKNDGNYEGEDQNQPGATSRIGDFPGGVHRRSQLSRRAAARLPAASRAALVDLQLPDEPGRRFLAVRSGENRFGPRLQPGGHNVPISDIQAALLAGYPDAPVDQTLYFGTRGSAALHRAMP